MSRSRKKIPICKDHNSGMKRFANKRVRKTKNIPNGKFYRKVFDSYSICDWKWFYDWNTYVKSCEGLRTPERRDHHRYIKK